MTTLRRTGSAAAALVLLLAGCSTVAPDRGAVDSGAVSSEAETTATAAGPTPSAPGDEAGAPSATPEPEALPGVPTEQDVARARSEVGELSLRRLAGQVVVASYGGTDPQVAADLVTRHHLAGVITLGDNVPADPGSRVAALTGLTAAVGDAVEADGRDWPAFLAIDQEGGPVTRVGAPLDSWPAAMALGAADDADLSRRVAQASGSQVRALGYTVVLAPIADVTSGPDDPTIGLRSPGSDPELVARVAVAQTHGYLQAGLVPVAKHFPGHGSVPADTHVEQARQSAGLQTLRARDLVPFEELVKVGAPAVMTAHIMLEAVDPDLPATLSPAVLTGLLRGDLGFTGLLVTDALNMQAVTEVAGSGEAAVLAVEAGADVVLMPADPGAAVDALVSAVEEGRLERARLEESAARVVATVRAAGAEADPDLSRIGADAALVAEVAEASVTRLDDDCTDPVVEGSVQVSGGRSQDRERFLAAAAAAGLGTGSGPVVALVPPRGLRAAGDDPGDPAGVAGQADVVVTLGEPFGLAQVGPEQVPIAAYDDSGAAMDAVVAVLTGAAVAPGSLPVTVGDHPVGAGCAG
jgi:beta-N-acetylhexosaminidase